MPTREEIKRKKKKQQRRKDLTPIVLIAILAIVVVIIVIVTQNKPVAKVNVPDHAVATQTDGLTMGDPKAKVQVIEFADFQCPACGNYWTSLEPTIITSYVNTGKVFFTYSPFSFLGQGHAWDESVKSAEAAYCANDQGKFWEYHNYLFYNQAGENANAFSRDRLLAIAKAMKLDTKTFTTCLDSNQYQQTVTDKSDFASKSGANYTPSFLVNGKLVNASELVKAIEDALK